MSRPVGYAAGMARLADELRATVGGLTRAEAAEAAELSVSRAGDILAQLARAGAVRGDGRPARYLIVDPPRLAAEVAEAAARP